MSPKSTNQRDKLSAKLPNPKDGKAVLPISKNDYYKMNAPFRLWLRKEKDRYFDEMTTEKARKYFGLFVREWNNGKLKSKYYKQTSELSDLSKDVLTRYSWGFSEKLEGELDNKFVDATPDKSYPSTVAASQAQKSPEVYGPTMPSRDYRSIEAGRLFDEEQRERERWNRKQKRMQAREREELILDEVAPKETGWEAKLAKKRAINRLHKADKVLDTEISDSEIYSGAGDDLASLKRDREIREKRRMERKSHSHDPDGTHNHRLNERKEKEQNTIEMLRALAQQSRERKLG
ncbi:hypothetical protein GGI05_005368, partial [Coemansia sp. RSA 2603]